MKKFFILLAVLSTSILLPQNKIIKVWPDKIPGAVENASVKEDTLILENGGQRIRNVIDPTLKIYFPPKDKMNGAAVVVCPGGGYARLAIDHEGDSLAVWMNKFGIAVFILKYRLPSDAIMKNKSVGPLQDAQEAIRIVRRNAKEWNLDVNRIGIMGFSAGGHLASTASTHFDEKVYDSDPFSARPDFSILIYPVISMNKEISHGGSRTNLLGDNPDEKLVEHFSNELQVNKDTPPTFLVHAMDDKTVPVQNSINYFLSLKKFEIPSELHVYEKGGHGFGLARNRGTESTWPAACIEWLKQRGIISR